MLIKARNAFFHFSYTKILKPFYFALDPEMVHNRMLGVGALLGRFSPTRWLTRASFFYSNPKLEQTILGIKFPNPIGLAAGFDKNAEITDILPDVGFGFEEVGSITGETCAGNPKKRLWRLPKSRSLVVYYGLKNDGCEIIRRRLEGKKLRLPLGISIAKTNSAATVEVEAGIADYAKAFQTFADFGAYLTVNISCPNAFGGEPFTDPEKLERLLARLDQIPTSRPVFLKLAADLKDAELDAILAVAERHRVHGFVCTNLTKDRSNPLIKDAQVPDKGGLSGKVVQELSDRMIAQVYKKTQGKKIIMGCGGVFTAQDAYKKIRLGASLIQLITGMIYEGPQTIGAINQGLVALLKKDGYENISVAIGADNRV